MRVLFAALCLVAGVTAGCTRRLADRDRALTNDDIVGSCQVTAELLGAKVNKRAGPVMENIVARGPTRMENAVGWG